MCRIKNLIALAAVTLTTPVYALEITPIFGYRAGGDFIDEINDKKHTINSASTFGIIITGDKYDGGKQFEVYYSHQDSELSSVTITGPTTSGISDIPLTIDYLHFGGTAPIGTHDKMESFVSGGLGFTYLSPDFTGLQSDLRASLSIGIGLKYLFNENVALRLETRGLATLYNNNSAIFCSGGCALKIDGNYFLQTEVFAGLAIKF